jgi:mannose-1-phosphate guanylyltransferase/mannose-6-phosphate isomerase
MPPARIQPVILAGGFGARLWPLSRTAWPKQFLPLESDKSLYQEALSRVQGDMFAPAIVICNEEHRFLAAQQLSDLGLAEVRIVLEPEGRNTAPAACIAALMGDRISPHQVVLLMPSDHRIEPLEAFHATLEIAARSAGDGALATLGIEPASPATEYGYIRRGDDMGGHFKVAQFSEKPDAESARAFIAAGGYYWNSGIFLYTAATMIAEFERFEPAMLAACRRALAEGRRDHDFERLSAAAFADIAGQSLDYAILERSDNCTVVPATFDWSDLGSWSAIHQAAGPDSDGNVLHGDILARDTQDCYIRTDGRLVATLGLRDLIVISTQDAVLVADRAREAELRLIVADLEKAGREEHLRHVLAHRPWGSFHRLFAGGGYQVKELNVKPGARLSLQKHQRRAEHWVVIEGEATVRRGDETFKLAPNQSTYIPLGEIHSLANESDQPLRLIEIQSGDYLGEDDIERFEDLYGRTGDQRDK